eukprot:Hpha_TRINITY_DN150_c0_g1::TRINITY_DN150_c0_g1_i1::g.82290::m.82290/K14731/mlhB, chnC; epsilon-lactone hydrolase
MRCTRVVFGSWQSRVAITVARAGRQLARSIPHIADETSAQRLGSLCSTVNRAGDFVASALPVGSGVKVSELKVDGRSGREWGRDVLRKAELLPSDLPTQSGIPDTIIGDAVRPEKGTPKGVMLYLHGGAYIVATPTLYRNLTTKISQDTGFLVHAPRYALAPKWRWPLWVLDALSAARELAALPEAKDGIFLGGDSAGGNLAVVTAIACREAGIKVRGLVAFSPWLDMTASQGVADDDDMLPVERMPELVKWCLPEGVCPSHPLVSPVGADLSILRDFPPVFLTVGSTEVLRVDSERFVERLRSVEGRSARLDRLIYGPELIHTWPIFSSIPESVGTLESMVDWIKSVDRA